MTEYMERFKQLENNLAYQLDYTAKFNNSFRRELHAQYIDSSLTPDEFGILYAISNLPDITQSEIARLLFKGKAHVGKILNDMETRGYIKRIADTKDNIIIKRNQITPKGAKIFKEAYKKYEKARLIVDKQFSETEIEQFIYYLKKFRKVLNTIVDVKLK